MKTPHFYTIYSFYSAEVGLKVKKFKKCHNGEIMNNYYKRCGKKLLMKTIIFDAEKPSL